MKTNKKEQTINQKKYRLVCPVTRTNNYSNKKNELISPVKRLNDSSTTGIVEDGELNKQQTASPALENIDLVERDENYYLVDKEGISKKQFEVNKSVKEMILRSKSMEIVDRVIQDKTKIISNNYKYIGEYLLHKIFHWKMNDLVFINCGTGTGKTTFIKTLIQNTTLTSNVLILTNRIANKKQIENALGYLINYYPKRIVIDSYQSIGSNVLIKSENLDCFDYIFCDESHFFLSDVAFNQMANSSFDKIMHSKKAIKIFLSATNEDMTKIVINSYAMINRIYDELNLLNKIWIYTLSYNRSNIDKIIKFTKFDEIVEQINLSDEKWLIFVKSIKDGEKYLKQLRDNTKKQVTFLNLNNITINEEDACKTLNDLIKFEKFEDDVLIATSIIDNGVNVVDRELTNIVSFEYDYIELIQEIGRKRCIDDYDKFTLYLISEKKNSLSGLERSRINMMNYFRTTKNDLDSRHTINPIIIQDDKNAKMYRKSVYVNQYKNAFAFNYLGYYNLKREIKMLESLRNESEDPFDVKKIWISNKLVHEPKNYNKNIERYIKSIKDYLNIEISVEDEETRLLLYGNFLKYIHQEASERQSKLYKIDRLQDRFLEFGVPIRIKKYENKYMLVYEKDK